MRRSIGITEERSSDLLRQSEKQRLRWLSFSKEVVISLDPPQECSIIGFCLQFVFRYCQDWLSLLAWVSKSLLYFLNILRSYPWARTQWTVTGLFIVKLSYSCFVKKSYCLYLGLSQRMSLRKSIPIYPIAQCQFSEITLVRFYSQVRLADQCWRKQGWMPNEGTI